MYGRCSLPAVLAGVMEYMLSLKPAAPTIDTHPCALCTSATLHFSIPYKHSCQFFCMCIVVYLLACCFKWRNTVQWTCTYVSVLIKFVGPPISDCVMMVVVEVVVMCPCSL